MVMKDADGNEISIDLHDVRFIDNLKDSGLRQAQKSGFQVYSFGAAQ